MLGLSHDMAKALIRLEQPCIWDILSPANKTPFPGLVGVPSLPVVDPVEPRQSEDDDHNDLMDNDFDDGGLHHDHDLQAPPQCSKRRLFSSQGTPEAPPFTEDQQGNKPFSQETLLRAVMPEIQKGTTVPLTAAEKRRNQGRKRKVKSNFASNSQPAPAIKEPLRAKDNVGVSKWHSVHELAKPILPPRLSKLLTRDMRSLHEGIHRVRNFFSTPQIHYTLFTR